ncbi:hypothetical protein CF326_g3881 [Tilletia indica]|nr:hypothetical protein CF326_g3881 [Tilletia indica]
MTRSKRSVRTEHTSQQTQGAESTSRGASQREFGNAVKGSTTVGVEEHKRVNGVSGAMNEAHTNGEVTLATDKTRSQDMPASNRATSHISALSSISPKHNLKIQTSKLNQKKEDENVLGRPQSVTTSNFPNNPIGSRTRPRASTISAAAANATNLDSDDEDANEENGPASASCAVSSRPKIGDPAPLTTRFASFTALTTTSQTVRVTQARPPMNTAPAVKVKIGSASSHWRRPSNESIASNASSTTTSSAAGVSPTTLTTANRFAILDEEGAEDATITPATKEGRRGPLDETDDGSMHVQMNSPKRPKSNTITGLAPQLWRAQRAAMEAAEGGTGVVSLLSGTHAPASDGSSSNAVKSGTDPALDQSFASYSSTDTVFSPVIPAPGTVLRSSRLRETISRRMTVSSDMRARNNGAEKTYEPTTNGADYSLYPNAYDVQVPGQVFESRRASEADSFYVRPDAPSTPRPLEVVGAALNQARTNLIGGGGECELCGILTTTLTVLLPCRHNACAACCSSGINQVSTSPPRSHVCAACRTPVESIALSKTSEAGSAEGMMGLLEDQETLAGSVGTLSGDEGASLEMSSAAMGASSVGPIPIPSGLVAPAGASAHGFASFGGPPPLDHQQQHVAQLQSPYGGPVARAVPPAATVYGAGFPTAVQPSMDQLGRLGFAEMDAGMASGCAALLPGFEHGVAFDVALDGMSELEMSPGGTTSTESDVSLCAVVRIDNIPWTVGCDDVMKWLPDPVFTLAPRSVCAQSVHIPIDLQSGKTSNACYLVCRDRKAAQRIVRARNNTKLCGRPVTLILSTFNELLDEVFTTRNLSASLEEDCAVYFTEQQLERLLLLLKEGGGQLKDGSKPIEFASSLMALVPRRLAIDQRELLFNAVHDMINYCLAVSSDMPSIRPALDRLLLSCSMCGAFAPDQKMTVIETARAALSAMMMTESMQKRGSPRARKSASLTSTIMNQSDGQRPLLYGGMPEDAGFRSRNRHMHPSPRPNQSPIHASGMVGSPLPPMGEYKAMGFQPYYNLAPYATPPYAAHEMGMLPGGHQNDGSSKIDPAGGGSSMRPPCGSGFYAGGGGMMPPGQQNLPQLWTPECSPFEAKTTWPHPIGLHSEHGRPGPPPPPTHLGPEHGPGATLHPPSYYGGMMSMSPSAVPGFFSVYPGSGGSLLPPYGYPIGMPPTSSPMPMPNVARQAPGAPLPHGGPRGLAGLGAFGPSQGAVGEGSSPYQFGLFPQSGPFNSQPRTNVDPPLNGPGPLRSLAPGGPVASSEVKDPFSGHGTSATKQIPASLRNDVSTSLQKLVRSSDGKLSGSGSSEMSSLATLASVLPTVKKDEDEFERLVEAVAQAMQKKKDGHE